MLLRWSQSRVKNPPLLRRVFPSLSFGLLGGVPPANPGSPFFFPVPVRIALTLAFCHGRAPDELLFWVFPPSGRFLFRNSKPYFPLRFRMVPFFLMSEFAGPFRFATSLGFSPSSRKPPFYTVRRFPLFPIRLTKSVYFSPPFSNRFSMSRSIVGPLRVLALPVDRNITLEGPK